MAFLKRSSNQSFKGSGPGASITPSVIFSDARRDAKIVSNGGKPKGHERIVNLHTIGNGVPHHGKISVSTRNHFRKFEIK